MAKILTISGSDSSGGAGIVADVRAIEALGEQAAVAITAVTAQNLSGVVGVESVSTGFVASQVEAALVDGDVDAVKIGMLHRAEVVEAVADVLERYAAVPVVLDPVLASTSGTALLDEAGVEVMVEKLFPRAALVTPNVPEARRVQSSEFRVQDGEDMEALALGMLELGARAVLVKGGHMQGVEINCSPLVGEHAIVSSEGAQQSGGGVLEDMRTPPHDSPASLWDLPRLLPPQGGAGSYIRDTYADASGIEVFEDTWLDVPTVRGTGCMLASAIATGLGQGLSMREAIVRGRAYVRKVIAAAVPLPRAGEGSEA